MTAAPFSVQVVREGAVELCRFSAEGAPGFQKAEIQEALRA
jgi:hypothetical protein